MAPSTRFERVTYRLGGDCSIQLSYEGVENKFIKLPGGIPITTEYLLLALEVRAE